MNKHILSFALALIVSSAASAFAQNPLESDPGYLGIDKAIDLKTVRPEVNVNLPRFLLKDAASGLTGGPEDPFAGTGINFADLIKDVKLIRVLVIEAGKNKGALDSGVKTLRAELESKWTPIVAVPEDGVGVYMRGDEAGEAMAGLAVLIYDGGDAVIANIVGQVPVGKIIQVAAKMDKLPKDILGKIAKMGAAASESQGKPEEAPEKESKASE